MPRLSIFKPEKGNDFKFFDRNIKEMFTVGGTDLHFHKYLGPYDQGDNNKDGVYDLNESTVDEGLFGINIHRATARKGGKSTRVDKWSAGCQVIADNDDWHEFLDICQAAREIHGNSFSYTLLESRDIS